MNRPIYPLALLLLPGLVLEGESLRGRQAQPAPVKATSLRLSDGEPFDTQGFRLFVGGFRCDSDGNVFFVAGLPAHGDRSSGPSTFVRVSADGRVASSFSLPVALGVRNPEDVAIEQAALDGQGNLHVLAKVRTDSGGLQYLVSFDNDGEYKSKVDLDGKEILVETFAVFGSGEFLLAGLRGAAAERRVVIMGTGGGSLRSVVLGGVPHLGARGPLMLIPMSLAAADPDGRVYLAPEGGPVYAITAAGAADARIEPAAPGPGARLVDLKVSGRRLAAIYDVPQPGEAPSVRYITVHDVGSGRRLASYGPVRYHVMCYRSDASGDYFRLLGGRGGQMLLFNASSP